MICKSKLESSIIKKAEPQESQVLRFNAATPQYEDKDVTANRHSITDFNQPQQSKSGVSGETNMKATHSKLQVRSVVGAVC
jgi:hypothetical protein